MKSKEIGIVEATNHLSKLIDQVIRGRRIYITRRRKRVAVLTSIEDPHHKPSTAILKALRSFRASVKRDSKSLKDLIHEARK